MSTRSSRCGTPFPARPILAYPNRVRDALLSLNHSKSYLCGSDFKIGQAYKHLHLTKYIYNEGIQAFSNDLQNRYSEYKVFLQNIKVQKKKTWNECTCRSILRNFLLYDSTLLDLESAFDCYLSLDTYALVKQYAKHFHA